TRFMWTPLVVGLTAGPESPAPKDWIGGARRSRPFEVASALLRPLDLRDPGLHLLVEHRKRERTVPEHDVVELLDVEAAAEALLRLVAEPQDLELPALVGQRLGGPGQVAIHLVLDVVLGEHRV